MTLDSGVIVATVNQVKIVWDEAKRASNLRKHGADFAAVQRLDWDSVIFISDDVLDGEVRHRALGFIDVALHALVFTAMEEELRVISLRKATKHEARKCGRNRLTKEEVQRTGTIRNGQTRILPVRGAYETRCRNWSRR